jgi:hypothetical protein
MALGTTPSVEGAVERVRALWRAFLYTSGCVLGGAAIAGVMTAVGSLGSRALWPALAGAAALGTVLRRPTAAPSRCWQVPKAWWRRLGDIAFLPAGATLTAGFFTPIIFPSFWILLLLFASLRPREALAAGAVFGLARSAENWRRALGRPGLGLDNPAGLFVARRRFAWRLVRTSLAATGVGALAIAIASTTG